MPNNLVFNNVANELKTQIYGTTTNGTLTPLLVGSDGAISIRALSSVTDTVSVTGQVSVVGQVTVVANDLDIRPLSSVTDTVTVTGIVEVIKDVASLYIAETALNAGTGTLLQADTSGMSMYSFYVRNAGNTPLTVQLQVSPTSTDSYFVADDTAIAISAGNKDVLVPKHYLNYTRISYTAGATASIEAYYNAQS